MQNLLYLLSIIYYGYFKNSSIKEKPCEEEMQLFSKCLTENENCEEFEEKYFKCMEAAK